VVKYHHSHPNNKLDRWLLGRTSMVVVPGQDFAVVVSIPTP